ncbi:MAG: O-antigen ligase family protein [Erythrobacter sp.]
MRSILALAMVAASFLMPALYSGALLVLLAIALSLRGVRVSPPLPSGSGVLIAVFSIFAALAVLGPSFNNGASGQNIDALKFLFAAVALVMGMSLGVGNGMAGNQQFDGQDAGLFRALPMFIAIISAFYGYLSFTDAVLSQESIVYPPDNNHSASMLAIFLPIVVLQMRGRWRLICLALLFAFAFFAASRALMALTLLATALSIQSIRQQKIAMLAVVGLACAVLFYRGFSMDNFSDRLRMQIIEVSLHYAQTRGAYAFNFGEASFADYLNIYPVYQRLEIQHAHNMLLQVWVAYGFVPLGVFLTFLVGFAVQGWRQRNFLFLSCFAIFMMMGMMEAIVTDIRAFGTIMFTLGYTYAWRANGARIHSQPTTLAAKGTASHPAYFNGGSPA